MADTQRLVAEVRRLRQLVREVCGDPPLEDPYAPPKDLWARLKAEVDRG
jgi:hypothetical protein